MRAPTVHAVLSLVRQPTLTGSSSPWLPSFQEADSFYKIVTGPPGGGKSTLLREACRNLGAGVGYLDVNPVRTGGRGFGLRPAS